MYKIAEKDTSFGSDVDASLEWVCTHELSHGLMDYVEEDLRKAAGYWKDPNTKTGAGEEPWSGYAKTSLGEDLAESATAYFIKRAAFKTKCPKRFAVIDAAVKAWKAPAHRRCCRGGRQPPAPAAVAAAPPRQPQGAGTEPPRADRGGTGAGGELARRRPRAPGRGRGRSRARGRVRPAHGLDEVETPTGRVVFDGDRVAVVYLSGHALAPDEARRAARRARRRRDAARRRERRLASCTSTPTRAWRSPTTGPSSRWSRRSRRPRSRTTARRCTAIRRSSSSENGPKLAPEAP